MQCRKFIAEQYAQTGLHLHKESTPTEVRREPDGKLTVVVKKPDGSTEEIAGNDVVMMATGESEGPVRGLTDQDVWTPSKGEPRLARPPIGPITPKVDLHTRRPYLHMIAMLFVYPKPYAHLSP